MGRVIPKGINQTLNVPAKVDFFKGKYVESEPVSVSSYYGCAGGMVVIFKVEGTSLTTKVVGMCKKFRLNHEPSQCLLTMD